MCKYLLKTSGCEFEFCVSRRLVGVAPKGAALAQLVEHRIRNAGVRCSSHLSGTITPFPIIRQRPHRLLKDNEIALFLIACVRRRV